MSSSARYANLNELDLSTPEFKEEGVEHLESDREIHPDHLSDDHGEGHAHKEGAPKSSMLGSALNIANTVMGSGVIALPNVISQFGILLGSLIIGFSCCLTIISCHLLLKAKNLSRHSKFITIGKHCFGVRGLWAVKAIIIVNNFGLCIIYLIVFSTTALNLVKGFSSEDCDKDGKIYCQHWLLVLIGTTIVLPFIFANSMAKLQKASVISVIAAITFSIATIEYSISTAATGENKQLDQVHVLPNIGDIVSALSSITSVFIAFTFQFNFFPVYKSLKNPTDKRMKITSTSGLLIALTIYLTAANAGYIAFPTSTQNFLQNFSRSVGLPTFIIVNCAFLFSSTLAQPLMFFGCKNEIYGVIKIVRRKLDKRRLMRQVSAPSQEQLARDEQAFDLEDEHDEKALEAKYGFKGIYYKLYVAVLFGFIVLMAIVVPGINIVFSFVGSTAANGLNFLLPALFYLHLCSKYGKLKKISIFIFVFGIISGLTGIITTAITL